MYSKNMYGAVKYAEHIRSPDIENYFVDLMPYLPDFLHEIKELKELFYAEGFEAGYLKKYLLDEIKAQMFVNTATWGLFLWEKEYGIETNERLAYERRREIIKAKMLCSETASAERIKQLAKAVMDCIVEVEEHNEEYFFIVRVVSEKGIPQNFLLFKKLLEEIKPAHLGYEFEFTYTRWNDVKVMKWKDMRKYTWNSVKKTQINSLEVDLR